MKNKEEVICLKGKNCTSPFCICYLEIEKKEDEKKHIDKI